jgi:hypothetical protein
MPRTRIRLARPAARPHRGAAREPTAGRPAAASLRLHPARQPASSSLARRPGVRVRPPCRGGTCCGVLGPGALRAGQPLQRLRGRGAAGGGPGEGSWAGPEREKGWSLARVVGSVGHRHSDGSSGGGRPGCQRGPALPAAATAAVADRTRSGLGALISGGNGQPQAERGRDNPFSGICLIELLSEWALQIRQSSVLVYEGLDSSRPNKLINQSILKQTVEKTPSLPDSFETRS